MINISNEDFYFEKANKRMQHIKEHIDSAQISVYVDNISNNKGNVFASIMRLASYHKALAVFSWFSNGDMISLRNNFYISACLSKMACEIEYDLSSPGFYMTELLKPLMSNEKKIISWFSEAEFLFNKNKIEDHRTADFYAYQAILAINGKWDQLIERCERVIANPPKSSHLKDTIADHRFYLGLASGNIEKMNSAIGDLISKKYIKSRNGGESGFTEDLISTIAVIYCKIAKMSGYNINVESPYIPPVWLAMEPLESYDKKYEFLS